MDKIQLAYSTFGLTNLDFLDAIDAVARAGYAGVEISFHRDQFNPFHITDADLERVRQRLVATGLMTAAVATASHFFMPQRPHEPSLMSPDLAGRRRRMALIRRGIHVARQLGAPLVTFGSGFVRSEHLGQPPVDAYALLMDSIQELLGELRDDDDITLLIEPEPGMLIETLDDGLALIAAVDSPRFQLHIDMCHAYCSDHDYLAALARAAPHARYLHISDARAGYNLKIVQYTPHLAFNLKWASTLVYFPDNADYLLVDGRHPRYFSEQPPSAGRQSQIAALLRRAGVSQPCERVDYRALPTGPSALDDEIFTYLISIPELSFDVLERVHPIMAWLRGAAGPALVEQMVANTRTGIVHFHEVPGEGTMDLGASFQALAAHGFAGFGAVELYHHVDGWQQALHGSYRHLAPLVGAGQDAHDKVSA